jgi:hypothetical protein
MPLSISNSRAPSKRHTVLLLLVCALFCAFVEAGAGLYFGRVSQMENRRQTEYLNALTMRSSKDRNGASLLIVGNSLLLHGVNFSQLQQALGTGTELRRMVVENTFYLDWYYGLRHVFKMGAQPDIVVLVLNPIQFASSSINGDYTVHFLVNREDLGDLARDIGAARNQMSSLALANLSSFYGTRAEIRMWLLGKVLPDLSHLFHSVPAAPTVASRQLTTQRLIQLRDLCAQHGADLVVVLPPARKDSGVSAILQAAAANGVTVLLPIPPGVLPSSDYSDNFHLNSQGAGKFTPALAAGLKQVLSQTATDRAEAVSVPSRAASTTF